LKRYFLHFYRFTLKDITNWKKLFSYLINPKTKNQTLLAKYILKHLDDKEKKGLKEGKQDDHLKGKIISLINALFLEEKLLFKAKKKSPYSEKIALRLFIEKTFYDAIVSTKYKVNWSVDRLLIFVIVGTIVGARLGHIIFYEHFTYYLLHPWLIFKTWEGGLASHGAAVAIAIALYFFVKKMKRYSPKISYVTILDLVCIPTALAAVFIRIGNFFNQEILGKATTLPWAIVFGHAIDGSAPMPRHPVQVYEAIFYLLVFLVLYFLAKRPYMFFKEGKLIGLFFILVFTFRFFIEFLKQKQSLIISDASTILMGQYLSIPFIVIGIILYFWTEIKLKISKHKK